MSTSPLSPFDQTEFANRLTTLRQIMRARAVQVMLLDDGEMLAYYTGHERSLSNYRACLVPLEGEPLMVLRSLDTAPFLENAWFKQHVGYADHEDPVACLAREVIARWGDQLALGIDFGSHGMTVDVFRRLQRNLPQANIVEMTGIPWELRLIKSSAEIQYIARAAAIADQTMLEITQRARPGMSGRDVAAFAARRYLELGASPGAPGPITTGKGWGFLHADVDDTLLQPDDILHLELTPRFRGYSARLMRSVVMGVPTAAQQDAAQCLIALQDRQIAAMQPGASARAVDAILREGVLHAGLREHYTNITGYTLGHYSQWALRSSDFTRVFHPQADWMLQAGMVFHMYTSAMGLAFSETVLVNEEGAQRLTRLARKLYQTEFASDESGFRDS